MGRRGKNAEAFLKPVALIQRMWEVSVIHDTYLSAQERHRVPAATCTALKAPLSCTRNAIRRSLLRILLTEILNVLSLSGIQHGDLIDELDPYVCIFSEIRTDPAEDILRVHLLSVTVQP